jgi:hypothetical protein
LLEEGLIFEDAGHEGGLGIYQNIADDVKAFARSPPEVNPAARFGQ